jgi:hypothetical protein
MKAKFFILVITSSLAFAVKAQPETQKDYRNFPLIVSLHFHSLSLPFRNLRSNLNNIGIGLGTEISLNGKHNWAQQFNAVWFRNKAIGNGLLFYTQAAWRPEVAADAFTEIKAGAGYLYSFRPGKSYEQVNGQWISRGYKGKGMLALPIGVSVGYHSYSPGTYFSPFVTYQFLIVSGYNASVLIVPETLIQVGTRIHFENKSNKQ